QWWNHGKTIRRNEPEYRPFCDILQEIYSRYQRPFFVAETGCENHDRPFWMSYIAAEVRAAIDLRAPVSGICLYPILNHPGWDDDRHCYNGLWDYPGADGSREIYAPMAEELKRLNSALRDASSTDFYEQRLFFSNAFGSNASASDLPVAS